MNKKYFLFLGVILIPFLIVSLWYYHSSTPIQLKALNFSELPGWNKAHIKNSFQAFQVSCHTFLRQDPEQAVGSEQFHMQVKDWQPICQAASKINPVTEKSARLFFQQWFKPIQFYQHGPAQGLFTGYYMPLLHGSLKPTAEYKVPIYGLPDDLISANLSDFYPNLGKQRLIGHIVQGKLLPYPTREAINNGAIIKHAPVLLWVNSPIDRLFLEIQGSGLVELPDGQRVYIGYAGENGAPYTSIGKVLIDRGIMTKDTASMQKIKAYLEAHPQEINPVLNKNASFVFFRFLNQSAALGAQGVNLTPGYSLAVDRKWIPLGMPLWLDTTHPDSTLHKPKNLQRLMIAQDTGGAIKGMVRGDVFWGEGERATFIAGNMKNRGYYWLLIPRHYLEKLPKRIPA